MNLMIFYELKKILLKLATAAITHLANFAVWIDF